MPSVTNQAGDDETAVPPLSERLLEALPFEAARIDGKGVVVAANTEWIAEEREAGKSCAAWCEKVHSRRPDLQSDLIAGLKEVLDGRRARFTQTYADENARRQIVIASCPDGAFILRIPAEPDKTECVGSGQSHKMETIGRLVGGVAHDFANILTLISGYSDLLLSRLPEKDSFRPEIDEIRKAALRGSRLTAQLLGYTRGQQAEPRPLDLNVLIADMQRMLRPIIGEYIELQTFFAPALGKVMADTGQMEQVLMNLILNARDAMPKGGCIRITTANGEMAPDEASRRGMRSGPCVMLVVSDDGHGLDPALAERVFEPFFTTKEKNKGTGLGLSTVRSIVKQCGGDVWISGAPGKGATFTVCLPRAEESAARGVAAVGAQPAYFGTETILLVEDEQDVRRLLAFVLRKRGYDVLEADCGEAALQLFESRVADIRLVVADMVMPRMSGRELAVLLLRKRPDLKVVFMSGYTNDVLVRTGALGPGMSFLQKPLRPETFAAKVREALDSPTRPFNPR